MSAAFFRPATESDVGVLLELMRALYVAGEGGAVDPQQGGEPAGYLVLTWGYSLEFHGRDAFIDELYVDPRHRGLGLGRQAVEWAEAACRAHGAGAMHLEVEIDNERAHALYRRIGFAERGLRLMTKRLDAVPEPR